MFENLDDPRKQALLALAAGLLSPVRGKGWSGFGEAASQGINAGLLGFNQAQRTQEAVKRGEMERKLEQMRLDQAKRQQEYQTGFDALSKQYFQPGVTPSTPVDDNGYPMPSSAPKADFSGFISQLPTLGGQGVKDALGYQQMLAKENPLDKYKPEKYTPGSIAKFLQSRNPADLVPFSEPEKDPEVIRLSNIANDPNRPAAQRQAAADAVKKSTTHAPPTSVSVNADKSYGSTLAEKLAGQDAAMIDAGRTAPDRVTSARAVKDLLQRSPITGAGAEARLVLNKALSTAGLIGNDQVADTETLASMLASQTLDAIKTSGLGSGQGFTDKDRQFLERAKSGNIEINSTTLLNLANLNERAGIKSIERANATIRRIKGNKSVGQSGVDLEEISVPAWGGGGGTSVTLPNGAVYTFPNKAAADAYKKQAGL